MLCEWKLAADGKWEEGITIPASEVSSRLDEVKDQILAWPQNVAVEAVFGENGVPETMLGVRMTPLSKSVKVERVLALFRQVASMQNEEVSLPIVQSAFPAFDLFSRSATGLNAGVIDEWYSFGEFSLWTPASDVVLTFEDFKVQAPQFFECTNHPVAIELWFAGDDTSRSTDHWLKIYVSDEQSDGRYRINQSRYDAAINILSAKLD